LVGKMSTVMEKLRAKTQYHLQFVTLAFLDLLIQKS